MHRAVFVIASCVLMACAGAPAKNSAPENVASVVLAPPPPFVAVHDPPKLLEMARPKSICELVGKKSDVAMSARPDGPLLLDFNMSPTRVTIGEKGEELVETTTPDFSLRGFASTNPTWPSVTVYPTKWLSFDGVTFESATPGLQIVGAHDGKITLAAAEGKRLDVDCSDISLVVDEHHVLRDTLPHPFEPGFGGIGRLTFLKHHDVPIALRFDGPPVATIRDPNYHAPVPGRISMHIVAPPTELTILETRGKKMRIAYAYSAGWVDASEVAIDSLGPDLSTSVMHEIDEIADPAEKQPESVSPEPALLCPHDVRIAGFSDDEPDDLYEMGTIFAGHPVRIEARGETLTELSFADVRQSTRLNSLVRGHMMTPTADLSGCTPTTITPFVPPPPTWAEITDNDIEDAVDGMILNAEPDYREREAIKRFVWSVHEDERRRCYQEGARKNPHLGGELEMSFEIDTNGQVTKITGLSSQIPQPTYGCVLGSFKSMTFAFPKMRKANVTVNFYFKPAAGLP